MKIDHFIVGLRIELQGPIMVQATSNYALLHFDNRPGKSFLFGERKLSVGDCWKKDKMRKITERRTESLTALQNQVV